MQEKVRAIGKKLYFDFVDLEKAFDRVPRVIRWAMRKLGVEVTGNSNGFEIKVGMHQRSALSPLLFMIVMEAVTREFRVALPWESLCTDYLVVIA